ncbi:MAG: hypothetical protein Q8M53_12890 [Burkholderiales bacterium]|nr:hypothetical protein [Burkholderiales bacterium]
MKAWGSNRQNGELMLISRRNPHMAAVCDAQQYCGIDGISTQRERTEVMHAGHQQIRRRGEDARVFIARFIEIHESQSRSARLELGRLRSLIDDASARLMTSFDVIGTFAKNRRESVPDGLDAAGGEIELAVSNAVSALQFQDMATQLVGHAAQRIELLEKIAELLGRLPEVSVDELTAAVADTTCDQHTGPVGQACMTGGSVELF